MNTRQVGVVDAPHHIGLRVAGGEHGLGHHRPGVLGDEQFDADARVGAEAFEGVDVGAFVGERVVDDEGDVAGSASPGWAVAPSGTSAAAISNDFMMVALPGR